MPVTMLHAHPCGASGKGGPPAEDHGDGDHEACPPCRQHQRQGWGTHPCGGERVGHPPATKDSETAPRRGWRRFIVVLAADSLKTES